MNDGFEERYQFVAFVFVFESELSLNGSSSGLRSGSVVLPQQIIPNEIPITPIPCCNAAAAHSATLMLIPRPKNTGTV